MNEQKQEIIDTRKGCLGGSDARLLQSVAELGSVPNSSLKRLAICKGLKEPEQFTNAAMEFGNFIEARVFESLSSVDSRWQSNPCIVSEKYSRKNVKCIDHVDFLLRDDEKKEIIFGECKATRLTFQQTRDEYLAQLCHHYLLGKELADRLGGYKVKIVLCHYLTDGLDVATERDFDPSRLTVKQLRNMERIANTYNLSAAMDLVDGFLETLDSYYEEDEIPYEMLPVSVQNQFDGITALLAEIKEREDKVNAFKTKLYDFLTEKKIKGIKNDAWSITRVDASTSKQFNAKKFLEEYAAQHPRKYKVLRAKYEKTVTKKGFVTIKLRNQNNND